jgi:hypothetical protein
MEGRPVKLACQISFDVGFSPELIADYVERSMQCFACEDWQILTTPCKITVSAEAVLDAEERKRNGTYDSNWLDTVYGE